MKKLFMIMAISLTLALAAAVSASAQEGYVPSQENIKAREAFEDMRFGVFIHWESTACMPRESGISTMAS